MIKQKITVYQPAQVSEIVQNNELVWHESQGFKMGDIAGANFKNYAELPPLFGEIAEHNGLNLVHEKKSIGALIASPVYTIHAVTTNQAQALAQGIWYEMDISSDVNRYYYQLVVDVPFNMMVAAQTSYNGIKDAAVMGANSVGRFYENGNNLQRRTVNISMVNGSGKLVILYKSWNKFAIPPNPARTFQAWGFNI